jgi:hypothetical protein
MPGNPAMEDWTMRALQELAGVIVAGFVAFFGAIAFLALVLLLWFFGLLSAVFLAVSVFGAVMYAFTAATMPAWSRSSISDMRPSRLCCPSYFTCTGSS